MATWRSRTSGWALSTLLLATVVVGVIAAVAVVVIGSYQQHHRALPRVQSAMVAIERPGQATARGVLTRAQANELAGLINRLRRAPSYGGCSGTSGFDDVITFATASGPIVAELTGCSFVNISSHGEDWGANKYDWDVVLAPTLKRDLPNLPWRLLDAATA